MRKSVIATLVALGTCVSAAAPATGAPEPVAEPVRTVFVGDSYTANFGVGPADTPPHMCIRSSENYPAAVARELGGTGGVLDVQADVSCGGALIHHMWEPQNLGLGATAPPQKDALRADTQLVVGSLGGNTAGFARIMKQCSDRLRGTEGLLLPADPVDDTSPASECRDFFELGDGAAWLDGRFQQVSDELREMFQTIREASPDAEIVLVGYPRIVPDDTTRCLDAIPGGTEKPLADIDQDAMKFLDQEVQAPLNDLMQREARDAGASFVDIYGQTGANTACDGEARGIGAMLEKSEVTRLFTRLPWFVHPNRTGRDIQAVLVADEIRDVLNA